jgi:transglutaminase-like putative cysteine protease
MLVTAFCGLNNETMPHHQGWLFFDIGRYLERVLHTMALFKLAFITARNPGLPLWEVVLTLTDNLTAYRRRYRSALHPRAIIDLLLFDEGNPRSIGYQLRRLQRNIGRLQRPNNSSPLPQRRGTAHPGGYHHPATGRYRGAGNPVPRQHPFQCGTGPAAGSAQPPAAGPIRCADPQSFQPCRSPSATDHHAAMKYTITHRTLYRYSSGVALCHNEARLLPRKPPGSFANPAVSKFDRAGALRRTVDFFGNRALYFAIQDIHQRLVVTVATEVEIMKSRPFNASSPSPPWEQVIGALQNAQDSDIVEARQFALDSPFVAAQAKFRQYAEPSFPPGRPLLEAVADLNRRINREFTYDPHFTTVATPLNKVLIERRGVCQDFAHLAIACLRALGLAARYVSGYLETLPPPGQPRLVGADASHAWLAVYVPGADWQSSIRPTAVCRERSTSPWRGGGITATSRRLKE